jgi:hypothetical protein
MYFQFEPNSGFVLHIVSNLGLETVRSFVTHCKKFLEGFLQTFGNGNEIF